MELESIIILILFLIIIFLSTLFGYNKGLKDANEFQYDKDKEMCYIVINDIRYVTDCNKDFPYEKTKIITD